MMTTCPECGSKEIVPNLILFAAVNAYTGPLFVALVDPSKKGERVEAGFRVSVCGACGHTELHTRFNQDLLNAHKKGYVTREMR